MATMVGPTRTEIAESLALLSRKAAREFPVVGVPGPPSGWDIAHARINVALDELERVGG